jgi:hypothetical protein
VLRNTTGGPLRYGARRFTVTIDGQPSWLLSPFSAVIPGNDEARFFRFPISVTAPARQIEVDWRFVYGRDGRSWFRYRRSIDSLTVAAIPPVAHVPQVPGSVLTLPVTTWIKRALEDRALTWRERRELRGGFVITDAE